VPKDQGQQSEDRGPGIILAHFQWLQLNYVEALRKTAEHLTLMLGPLESQILARQQPRWLN